MTAFLPGERGESDDENLRALNWINYGGSNRQSAAMEHGHWQWPEKPASTYIRGISAETYSVLEVTDDVPVERQC